MLANFGSTIYIVNGCLLFEKYIFGTIGLGEGAYCFSLRNWAIISPVRSFLCFRLKHSSEFEFHLSWKYNTSPGIVTFFETETFLYVFALGRIRVL